MKPKQEICGILDDLMKRRMKLCHLAPIPDTPENKEVIEKTKGDCQILVADNPEAVQRIDEMIELIEPLRETIIGQLQFIQTGSDPLKAEAAQRRIDADLAEARSILNGSFGMDSIQPVYKVTDADLQDWATEELWYKAVAISRVVSSRVVDMPVAMQPEDMREAANRMLADTRSLLARTIGTEWQYKTTVKPIDWLIWCRNQGFDASPALWDAVNARVRQKKSEGLGDAYPEIAEADIRKITDLDAALYPSPYDAGLLGELTQRLGELLKNGWQPEQASKTIKEIICKGELLVEIADVELNLQSLDPTEQDYIERKERADRKLAELRKKLASIMGQSGEGLDVFKTIPNLRASKVTVRLLRKEGRSLPDRVAIEAMRHKRTVSLSNISLASTTGLLNREGQMLFALSHGQLPQSVKANGQAMTEKSKAQAMTKLRKIFKGIGIMDKDPFLSKKAGWQPRFKLIDAMEQADKRKAQRAIHVSYDENILYSQPKTKKRNGSHGDHVAPDSPDLKKWNKKDCHECNSVLCVEKSGSVWKCTECGAIRDDAVEGDAATNEWLREHDK